MLVKHTLPIVGHLKIGRPKRLEHRDTVFEFLVDHQGFLSELAITLPVPVAAIPSVTQESGKPFSIVVPSSASEAELWKHLRTIEGLLAIYGLHEIKRDYLRTDWLPQSKEERELLALSSFSLARGNVRDQLLEPIPFDIVARNVLGACEAGSAQVPLNFFRKGRIDMDQERYVDAIYDFYFVFEHLYADGKHKQVDVKKLFKASAPLQTSIETARATRLPLNFDNQDERAYFREKSPVATPTSPIRGRGKLLQLRQRDGGMVTRCRRVSQRVQRLL